MDGSFSKLRRAGLLSLRNQTKQNILDFASKWIDASCEAVDGMSFQELLKCNYAPGNYPPKDE
jgi:hypothetical protein